MKLTKNKLNWLFLILLVGGGFTIALIRDTTLQRNHTESVALIYDVRTSSKSADATVKYKFTERAIDYTGSSAVAITNTEQYHFLYRLLKARSLPIVFKNGNPNNNRMLLTSNDYKKYNISIPVEYKKTISMIDSLVSRK